AVAGASDVPVSGALGASGDWREQEAATRARESTVSNARMAFSPRSCRSASAWHATSMTDKHALIQPDRGQQAIPVHLVDKAGLEEFVKSLSGPQRAALAAQKFEAEGFSHAILPDGESWSVVAGVADAASLSSWCMARLAEVLPA